MDLKVVSFVNILCCFFCELSDNSFKSRAMPLISLVNSDFIYVDGKTLKILFVASKFELDIFSYLCELHGVTRVPGS